MHRHTTYKELQDPFAHYTRGVLLFDEEKYSFVAYRMPYVELDDKTWKTEQAFHADYQKMIARKYGIFE